MSETIVPIIVFLGVPLAVVHYWELRDQVRSLRADLDRVESILAKIEEPNEEQNKE